jgi:hypothetical protein
MASLRTALAFASGLALLGLPTQAQTFAPFQSSLIDAALVDADWADYDKDGYLDFGLSSYKYPVYIDFPRLASQPVRNTRLYRYDPATSQFVLARSYNAGGMRLTWIDNDRNSWPDLMVSSDSYGPNVLMNPGMGSPTWAGGQTLASYGYDDTRVADFNRSGRMDQLTIGLAHDPYARLTLGPTDFMRSGWSMYPSVSFGLLMVTSEGGRTALGVGDLDNDGVLDVVESGQAYLLPQRLVSVTRVLKGSSPRPDSLHFLPMGDLAPLTSGSLSLFDYDGDGDLDILATGCTQGAGGGYATHLYRNDGNFVFTEIANTGLDAFGRSAAAFADVNGDGRPDLLLTGNTAAGVKASLYLNQGPGANPVFVEDSPGSIPGADLGAAHFGDFDHDGKPDLLLTGLRPDGKGFMAVYRNVRP